MSFKDLIKKVLRKKKDANLTLLEKAYAFAGKTYLGEVRDSGDSLLDHTVQSSLILANLKLDEQSIAACLLHHCLSLGVSAEQLKRTFGEEVTTLVLGVNQISTLKRLPGTKNYNVVDLRKILLFGNNEAVEK